MLQMMPSAGMPLIFFVTFCHVLPASRDRLTVPSVAPVQITPDCTGDSTIEYRAEPSYTIRLSACMPPESSWWLLSLRVWSGLITCQDWPPSWVMWTYWLLALSLLLSCGVFAFGFVLCLCFFFSLGVL